MRHSYIILLYLFSVVFTSITLGENVKITDENWRDMLNGEWMIKFYAPWCPACRAVSQTWNELAVWATKETSVSVGSVDVTAEEKLNGRFLVTSLPTIYYVRNGEFRQYTSSRTLSNFQEFIEKEQWRSVTPMSSWLGPDSFTMNAVSKIFSMSMKMKTMIDSLRTDYGLSGWVTMLLFGLVIILIGLGLGIGLVFLLDWYMGPEVDVEELQKGDNDEDTVRKKTDAVAPDDDNDGKSENDTVEEDVENEDGVRKRNVKINES